MRRLIAPLLILGASHPISAANAFATGDHIQGGWSPQCGTSALLAHGEWRQFVYFAQDPITDSSTIRSLERCIASAFKCYASRAARASIPRQSYEADLVLGSLRPTPLMADLARRQMEVRYEATSPAQPSEEQASHYRLRGDKDLFPSLLRDDGGKTYIVWPESVPMPAVFFQMKDGKEELVDGYMRRFHN